MTDSDHRLPDRALRERQAPAEAEAEAAFLAKVRALRAIRAGDAITERGPRRPNPA